MLEDLYPSLGNSLWQLKKQIALHQKMNVFSFYLPLVFASSKTNRPKWNREDRVISCVQFSIYSCPSVKVIVYKIPSNFSTNFFPQKMTLNLNVLAIDLLKASIFYNSYPPLLQSLLCIRIGHFFLGGLISAQIQISYTHCRIAEQHFWG